MYSCTFNNTWLGLYGLSVQHVSRHNGLPDVRLDSFDLGGRDGSVDRVSTYGPSFIALEVKVEGPDQATFVSYMDSIRSVLDPVTVGEKLLVLDHESTLTPALRRGYWARLHAPMEVSYKGDRAAVFALNFRLREGHPVAVDEVTQAVTIDETPEAWNVPASGVAVGNGIAWPTYTFTQTSATAVTVVTLANGTRSESLTWTGSLAQDNQLRIDTERREIHKSTNGGTTWVTAMSGKGTAAEWPLLTGGVANAFSLALTGSNAGTMSVTYRGRFL